MKPASLCHRSAFRPLLLGVATLAGLLGIAPPAQADGRGSDEHVKRMLRHEHERGEILIRFRRNTSEAKKAQLRAAVHGRREREMRVGRGRRAHRISRLRLRGAMGEHAALKRLLQDDAVVYAEPNYRRYKTQTVPNDPRFPETFGLHNTGQTGGTADADIDAPEAWSITTGSPNVVIAVLDEGTAYNHPDLKPNMWTNPNEIPGNGIDDDGNGYVDDVHGADFYDGDGDPINDSDTEDHATHVAGTIGAAGNNGTGVAGVNWTCRIMALRFLGPQGGDTQGMVDGIQYAIDHGANAINMSFGGGGWSQVEYDAIIAARDAGIVVLAAAGNGDSQGNPIDVDQSPEYPGSYDLANIITVAAVDHNDQLASWSNFGLTSVDLAAPGVSILSCAPGNAYQLMSGTSMATPHVAGVVGLIFAAHPGASVAEVRARLLNGADPVAALSGKVVTGARLNALNAVETDTIPPADITDLQAAAGVPSFAALTLTWTAPGDDGMSGALQAYDIRYSTAPITDAASFQAATRASAVPTPGAPGSLETYNLNGLERQTSYYVAIQAVDNVNQRSAIATAMATTGAGTVVFSDGFESGLSQWTAEGSWGTTSPPAPSHTGQSSASESPVGSYSKNLNAALTTAAPIDLTGFTHAVLDLWIRYDLETGYDYAYLEVSGDGQTYTELAVYNGKTDAFEKASFDLGAYANGLVYLRMRVTSDRSVQLDGIYLDDVQVTAALEGSLPAPPEAIFSDDFENGLSQWTADSPWGISNGTSETGSLSAADSPPGGYADNADVSLTSIPIDVSQHSGLKLLFTHTYDIESGYDFGYVEVQADGAGPWTTLATYTGTGNRQDVTIGFDAFANASQLSVRFRLVTDYSVTYDGWFVDDVVLMGSPENVNTPPTVTIEAPATATAFDEGFAIAFAGTGTDAEDGDLSPQLQWTSDLDGAIGSGSSFSASTLRIGTHAVTASVTDSGGAEGSAAVSITVLDATPPVIAQPANLVAEQQSASGSIVSFQAPSATDNHDPSPTVTCSPTSGSTFPAGSTLVTCTATDAAGNSSTATFTVTVRDTIAPTVTTPGNVTAADNDGSGGEVVTFSASADDAVDPSPNVTCTPASGSIFPVGDTVVTCTATDAAGNQGQATFTVTVTEADTVAPTFDAGSLVAVSAEQTNASGSVVTFATPTATDDKDPNPQVTCSPASGTLFGPGPTQVTCTATDAAGNSSSASFTVTVQDTTAPTVNPPADIALEATGPQTSVTLPSASATDAVDPSPTITNDAPATFSVGSTLVTFTATDASGNVGFAQMTVTVHDTAAPTITAPSDVTREATGPQTSVSIPPATATDVADPSPVITDDAPATFGVGATLVTFTATDASGNQASASMTVTITDTAAPAIATPGNLTVQDTDGSGDEVVTFQVTANDLADPNATVVCTPASGSIFPLGDTVVTCIATDASNNSSQATFTVTVEAAPAVPADDVSIRKAEWKQDKNEVKVEAMSSLGSPEVVMIATYVGIDGNSYSFTLDYDSGKKRYKGRMKPAVKPAAGSSVTVTSSLGGTATKAFRFR